MRSGFTHKTEPPRVLWWCSSSFFIFVHPLCSPLKPSTGTDRESSIIFTWNWTALTDKGQSHSGPSCSSLQIAMIFNWAEGWPPDQTVNYVSKDVQQPFSLVLTTRKKIKDILPSIGGVMLFCFLSTSNIFVEARKYSEESISVLGA